MIAPARDMIMFAYIDGFDVNNSALKYLQTFLSDETNKDKQVLGKSLAFYGSATARGDCANDLVSPIGRMSVDPISALFADTVGPWFASKLNGKSNRFWNDAISNDNTWYRVTMILTSVVASLVQVGFISLLFIVKSTSRRLLMLCFIMPAFSVLVMLFASPRRNDLFSINAAVLAVLIIFIGSNSAAAEQT